MNSSEYEQLKEFINNLLYKTMSLDDYEIIMNRLKVPKPNKNNSENWMYKTLCHNVDLNSCKNNLAFYTETRTYYCFSECNCSYNLITLVEKRFDLLGQKKSRFQCIKWICEQLNIEFNFKSADINIENNLYNWQNELSKYLRNNNSESEMRIFDKSILKYFEEKYHIDWINDNITLDTMDKYKIKYYPYHDSIIIPCFNTNGDLCGIRERFMNPNSNVKYLPLTMLNGDNYKFPVNRTLYGLNYNAENIKKYKKVVLFEAEKSVLQTNGYFGCKNYSVALYGKSMSNSKLKQLLSLGIEECIIALDFDYDRIEDDNGNFTKEFESFKKNVYRIGKYFKPYCKVTAIISYNGHKKNDSPSDNGKDKYIELFNERENLYESI